MKGKKEIGRIVLLACLSYSLSSAGEIECKENTEYFLAHFATTKNPEKFNLQWAKCEEKLGNEEGAMSAYERVLMANPNNSEALVALAKYYQENHMTYESKELRRTVDNSRLSPKQRQIVASMLKDEKSLVSTRLSLALDFGYDDNLNLGIYPNQNGSGKIDSAFHALSFSGNYVNELEEVGGFSFQSNANLYWQENYHAHYYDTLYGAVDAGVGYSVSNLQFYLPFVYRRIHYLDMDLYEQYGIAPRLTASMGEGLLLNFELKYLQRNHKASLYKNADDTLTNIAMGAYQFYGDNYIYAQVKYNRFDADNATPALFTEYDYFQFFAGGSYEIADIAIAGINYQYGYGDYSDMVPFMDGKREDELHQITLSLQRGLSENIKVVLNYVYADNESNYDVASYHKQTVTIGLMRYLLLLLCMSAMVFASIGNIAALKGVVKIKRNAKTITAKYGLAIEEKDIILTQNNSKVQIILKDQTIITVGENSKYSFNEYRFNSTKSSKAKMKLDHGFFRVITGKIGKVAPERFKVQTKSATIGIRGTNFFAWVGVKREEIGCIRGKISILTNRMQRFTLAAGHMASLQANRTWKRKPIPRAYKKKLKVPVVKKTPAPATSQVQQSVLIQESHSVPPAPTPPVLPPNCLP